LSADTKNREKAPALLRRGLPVLFWAGVWIAAAAWVGRDFLLPGPGAVLRCLWELGGTALFWRNVGLSVLRIFCGILGGTVLGCLLAVLCCRVPVAEWILAPAIRVLRATPVASFILLVLLWVQRDYVPVLISGMMVMTVVWESVRTGIRSADPSLLEMSLAYEFRRAEKLRCIYLPAVRPYFTTAVCTAIGLAWKSGVAAEVICVPRAAIGTQVYYTKLYLETPALFAWTIAVVLLSLLLERLARRLLKGRGKKA